MKVEVGQWDWGLWLKLFFFFFTSYGEAKLWQWWTTAEIHPSGSDCEENNYIFLFAGRNKCNKDSIYQGKQLEKLMLNLSYETRVEV